MAALHICLMSGTVAEEKLTETTQPSAIRQWLMKPSFVFTYQQRIIFVRYTVKGKIKAKFHNSFQYVF